MFPNLLSSANAFAFPAVTNTGTLFQVMPDNTQAILRFTGTGSAPNNTSLNIEQSVGGGGPWTTLYGNVFTLNGIPLADFPVDFPGPYASNNYFRYRWENVTLGYVGPWNTFAGPTTKNRWDVTTAPIAPSSIPSTSHTADRYVTVSVLHSLLESANYSYTGIKVSATVNYSNGLNVTMDKYFPGWGISTVVPEDYIIDFGNRTPLYINAITAASASYYVLGSPLPGIVGTPVSV